MAAFARSKLGNPSGLPRAVRQGAASTDRLSAKTGFSTELPAAHGKPGADLLLDGKLSA
jgi:hypothetical protein